MKKNIVFKCMMAPGDILVLTTAIRELHRCYPDQFNVKVISPYPEITYNNPRLISKMAVHEAELVELNYIDTMRESIFSGRHFTDGFIENINEQLDLNIKKEIIFPEVYLTDEEKDREKVLKEFGIEGKFWLFNAGFKLDIPLKTYPHFYWEKIIEQCNIFDIQLIQVGSHKDIHPEFGDIKSLVGKTEDLRKYMTLCYHAEGHIGAISLQMHLMAAYRKPCIILAGGRENVNWELYPKHQFFHSVGYLDCCRDGGCWRKQRYECIHMDGNPPYPKCMMFIKPKYIVESILNYSDYKE